jgi:high-affinity iron transporter
LLAGVAVALVIAVAGIVLAALNPFAGSADPGRKPISAHVAPSPSPPVSQHRIYGTDASAQELSAALADEVPGPGGSSAATYEQDGDVLPLPVSAFRRPVAAYRSYAEGQARAMAVPARALVADLRAGDRPAARADWAAAYTRYLRLGAAYGALGDLDVAIDGGDGGLTGGVDDPHFTGLHRVEHDLWTGTPAARIVPVAQRLQRDVGRLPHAIAALDISPLDYATRAHEILEDAQRDQLSGVAAPWSGAGVLATAAAADATQRVIATLRTTLVARADVLPTVQHPLAALQRQLHAVRRAHHGAYPRLDDLTERERSRLNGVLGAALEALAGVPGALETARPPKVEPIP